MFPPYLILPKRNQILNMSNPVAYISDNNGSKCKIMYRFKISAQAGIENPGTDWIPAGVYPDGNRGRNDEKDCSKRASSFGRSPGRGLGAYPQITFPPFVNGGRGDLTFHPPIAF